MRAYLAGGLLAILASLAGWGWWQHSRAVAAETRAATAEARAAALDEATRALSRHIATVQDQRDHWRAVASDLETKEGADEPLNDYERAVLDRVRAP